MAQNASKAKGMSLLVDISHNNLISPLEPDFTTFFNVLKSKGYEIESTQPQQKLTDQDFVDKRTLILGVPQCSFLFQEEINSILNFIRTGGSLLLIHRYGGDLLQKANLNDLASNFGMYFETTLVNDTVNAGLESLPIFSAFPSIPIMDGIHRVALPGSCSLRLAKDAQMLCKTSETSNIDIFNPHTFEWLREDASEPLPLAAYAIYGQGRVVAIGTSDFIVDEDAFGISQLDNKKFCLNLFQWLMNPVSEMEIRDWMLQQLGSFSEDISDLKMLGQTLQSTLESFDRRVRDLEYKYYALEGVHIPQGSEEVSHFEETTPEENTEISTLLIEKKKS